ncbi:alanine--tRNA ligase [Candidatus Micrarchaeota archaeon]|nr:alanine--tRNA ligase [Candidatus Micrarchaeota archaeon]
MNKIELRNYFGKEYKKEYEVELFKREGFTRKQCVACGKFFWSLGEKNDCGDSSHNKYSFIKSKPLTESYGDFWKKTKKYWEKTHEVIPRYPVVSRWRDDLYFTIASIVDFMRLEKGKVSFDFPHPKLIVPQLCMRFVDIANVGVTGRHLSSFMMLGQHSHGKKGYWKNECLEYNYEYLTTVLKIPKEEITYGEDVWAMPDYSAYGPCIESFSKGSELVNSVFMQYYQDSGTQKELPEKVIDVGWGFERLLWYYTGDLTIYDAVFKKQNQFIKKETDTDDALLKKYAELSASLDVDSMLDMKSEKIKIASQLGLSFEELEKQISPMQATWAIADHSRTLLIAVSDGAIPSNAAGGYNLRVLARRLFGFKKEYNLDFDLMKLMELHARELKEVYPELSDSMNELNEIMSVEENKYLETLSRGEKIALNLINSGLNEEKLVQAYESNGVTPEIIERIAKENHKQVEVPLSFYKKITEKHVMDKKKTSESVETAISEKTYYDHQYDYSGKAKIVSVGKNYVVLDKTLFYPEGGGQCADHGWINSVKVTDVQRQGDAILHFVEKNDFKKGESVELKIDVSRRQSIQRHHSATHLMIACCRSVLGNHVWQCGSKKDDDEAHLDITHFKRLTRKEKNDIELLAESMIRKDLPITWKELDRAIAEEKYGFRLYQGGGAIGKKIRVVEIKDLDAEACGGLHVSRTSEIGLVKITSIDYVQDGVVRIKYKAGPRALEYIQSREELLEKASFELSVQPEQLPSAAKRFFDEWNEYRKQVDKLKVYYVEQLADSLVKQHPDRLVKQKITEDSKFVEAVALRIAREPGFAAIITNNEGFVAAAANESSAYSAVDLLLNAGAKGGGNKVLARGKLG